MIKKILLVNTILLSSLIADEAYSLMLPTEKKFLTFLEENNFTAEMVNEIYEDCKASAKNAFICALAYDYGLGERSKEVESMYQLAADSEIKIGNKSARIEYADYMIRGGEAGFIGSYFNGGECYTKRIKGPCFYYLGMGRYLNGEGCKYLHNAARAGTKKNLVKRLCDK